MRLGSLGVSANSRYIKKDMIVAINCLSINTPGVLGIRTALMNHVTRLSNSLLDREVKPHFIFFVQRCSDLKTEIEAVLGSEVDYSVREVDGVESPAKRIAYEQLVLPFRLSGVSVLFSINGIAPLMLPRDCRSVVMVHDLLPFHKANRYGWLQRSYLQLFMRLSARRASRLITISNFSAKEIQEFLGIPFARIEVVYHFLNREYRRSGRSGEHFLSIAGLNADKRIDVLIRAFDLFKREGGHPDSHLLIAGPDQGAGADLKRLAQSLRGGADDIEFLGAISESRKCELIESSIAVAMLGRSEGFGIPVIEAMSLGRPTLAANSGALPEVVGEAGVIVDGADERSVMDGMQRLAESGSDWEGKCSQGYERFDGDALSRRFWMLVTQHA